MDNTKYVALSRQMGLWKQMDIVSNNMANMNTSGYKQDEAIFSSSILLKILVLLRILPKAHSKKPEIL